MLQFEFNNGKDGEKDNQSEPDASQNLAPSYIVSTTKVPSNWCHVIAKSWLDQDKLYTENSTSVLFCLF